MKQVRMIGFSGHQGLPPATTQLVERALRVKLKPLAGHDLIGVTMLGPGADQLFARVVLELGGALYVVQPTTGMQYRDSFEDPDARRGYNELAGRATYTERLAYTESTEAAHMAGGRAVVDACELLVAVWDGQPARGHGGTADVVAYARQVRRPVEIIWPEGASRD